MRAGSYDTQATFERLRDPPALHPVHGTPMDEWLPLVAQAGSPTIAERFWVRALDVLQARSESVKQNIALSTGRVGLAMRYRSDVTSAMRVTLHRDVDTIYQIITEPAMIGRKVEIEMVLEKYSTDAAP